MMIEFAEFWWHELVLDYVQAFNPPAGMHIPKLFLCFDFCASLFTVLFFFVASFSLYLHLRTLWLRHSLLRGLGAVELARLEAQI